ncbi:MAG: GntR family transcriptional regulator [Alphaproteobacteria bacterium]
MTAAVKARKRSARSGPATSRAEYVEARIREAIQDGRYQPGARLRETEIAERLKVSRTPVREALRRLESEGLLGFVPWRGVVVAQLDRRQVMELYAMRAILEGAAAGLAARQVQPAEIDLLDALLARAEAAEDHPTRLASINREFHQAIQAAAHNRYLTQTLDGLRNALALLRGTTFALPGRAAEAQNEHRSILDAIRAHDAEAAETAARAHIAQAERARLRMLLELDP